MDLRAAAVAAVALTASACCKPMRFDPRLVDDPIAGRFWVSPDERFHPLVGKIWAPREGRFVEERDVVAALASAEWVALGEVHDNPDHHLLQARLLREMLRAGHRPALGFEMIDADQQPAVDAALAAAPHDPDAIGSAVRWDRSGWPPFRWYRPILDEALAAGLPVVAANLSRDQTKQIRAKGLEGVPERLRARLERDGPLPPEALAALRAEMAASHCGLLPPDKLDPLVLVQRAKDAEMALRTEIAGVRRGAVLICGAGHARNDRGVPASWAKDAPRTKVVAVGLFEVERGRTDPTWYQLDEGAKGPVPFDFVVFTPRAKREDPCEGMRRHLEQLKAPPNVGIPQEGPRS